MHPKGVMQGRIKRKQQQRTAEERTAAQAAATDATCALCKRPLGARVEWHHPVPKSQGGMVTVPVHPICHRTIHATVSNHDLAGSYADLDTLRGREDMQRFLRWIAEKPPDFNAPTRQSRGRRDDAAAH